MKPNTVHIALKSRKDSYDIVVGADLAAAAADIRARWPGARTFIITDSNVEALYGRSLAWALRGEGPKVPILTFPAGEKFKTRATRDRLEDELLAAGLTRGALIVALGGGVVGDVAGFVAATILRGVPFVQVPTTLLAQVDSSVGGKVAIDHPRGKNLLGAFHQPRRVYIDPETLRTLPDREFRAGLAEVVKIAAVKDRAFFSLIETDLPRILARDSRALGRVIRRSCALKAAVVEADERDSGPRRILNFGHTIGHALETLSGYALLHGEAVAIGMAAEASLAVKMGLARPADAARLVAILERCSLPTRLPSEATLAAIGTLTASDKKASATAVHYTLLGSIGRGRVGVPITRTTLRTHWPL
jgi:3-dehydroquinate synthase